MSTLWDPGDGKDDGPLRVEALPLVRKPVVVETTKSEMRRLVQRMTADRASGAADLTAVSNRAFRRVAADPTPEEGANAEWESFCGDVLVLYCARYVLDGRGIPVRQ